MPRSNRHPDFLALQRRQLDSKSRTGTRLENPSRGWIRAVRLALGMSAAQLGKRLKMSQQAVAKLELNEQSGAIGLATLTKVAEALDCDVELRLVPRTSLEETVRKQARLKAQNERNRIVHTMRLEAQEHGVVDALDVEKATDAWMTSRIAELWD